MSLLQIHQHKQLLLSRCSSSTGTSRFGMLRQAHCSHIRPVNSLIPRKVCCGAGKRPGGPSGRSNAAGQQQRSGQRSQLDGVRNANNCAPNQQGSALQKTITNSIKDIRKDSASSLQELEDIVDQWGSSFNYIHASAAFVKAGSINRMQPAAATRLLDRLASIWDRLLPGAGAQALANVLWAWGKLRYNNPQLWSSTLDAILEHKDQQDEYATQRIANILHGLTNAAIGNKGEVPGIAKEDLEAAVFQLVEQMLVLVTHPLLGGVEPQHISNTLWACAKLGINPSDAALDSLLQAMSRPALLDVAKPQELYNMLWAVGNLQHCGIWQPRLKPQVWQRLLGEQQLARIADKGIPQGISNVLLALAWLGVPAAAEADEAAGPAGAVMELELAQQCARQLLQGKVAHQAQTWSAQTICNSMWACGKLGLMELKFFRRAASASGGWLPTAVAANIKQAAYACRVLQFKEPQLMAAVVERSKQLQQKRSKPGASTTPVGFSAMVAHTVAVLDMQQLAGDAVALVASTGVGPSSK